MFRQEKSLTDRVADAKKLLIKNPLKVPVVLQFSKQAQTLLQHNNEKTKYLVPANMTLGNLMQMMRTRFSIKESQALFFFVDGVVHVPSTVMSDLRQKSEDGFVVIDVMLENTFGAGCLKN